MEKIILNFWVVISMAFVDWSPWYSCLKFPFAMSILGDEYIPTISVVRPDHVMKLPFLMADIYVLLPGAKTAPCKNSTRSTFGLSFYIMIFNLGWIYTWTGLAWFLYTALVLCPHIL